MPAQCIDSRGAYRRKSTPMAVGVVRTRRFPAAIGQCRPWLCVVTAAASLMSVGMIGACAAKDSADDKVQTKTADDRMASEPVAVADDVSVPDVPGRTHLVAPDDTLFSLAQKYYGNGKFYRRILVANRNRIKDPNKLSVGMKLIIP